MGVGEEEWGSGEREVLEDFARRTEGLIDLTVSRFGEPSKAQTTTEKKGFFGSRKDSVRSTDVWMGAGSHAQVGDGLVFSGTGALSRASLRDVSHWTQNIYAYGEHAYGVHDHPSNDRRKRKRHRPSPPRAASYETTKKIGKQPMKSSAPTSPRAENPPGIPPPIISAVERSLERATSSLSVKKMPKNGKMRRPSASPDSSEGWTRYLTLGYGSKWGPSTGTQPFKREDSLTLTEGTDAESEHGLRQLEPEPDVDPEAALEERLRTQVRLEDNGHFLIGLTGELTEEGELEGEDEDEWNQRTMLRTLHVEIVKDIASDPLETPESKRSSLSPFDTPKLSRLRVVVYVHRPFIYTFLFHLHTDGLKMPTFYRNLHTFFAPLHRPLSDSTAPARVAARIAAAAEPYTTAPVPPTTSSLASGRQPIFDLVHDPLNLSVHASIPNIPMPGSLAAEGLGFSPGGSTMPEGWSRVEAINVHSAMLEVIRSTRRLPGLVGEGGERELERSVKTGRGWWVVWMRLDDETSTESEKKLTPTLSSLAGNSYHKNDYFGSLASRTSDHTAQAPAPPESLAMIAGSREAILVRRARDALPPGKQKSRGTSGIWGMGLTGGGDSGGKDAGSGWGPARLAEGVGVDARKYVEGLLSLNR